MKNFKIYVTTILVLFLSITQIVPVYASTLEKNITFGAGENGSIFMDRILYHAFKEMGYTFSIVLQDLNSSVATADSGMIDGLLQAPGDINDKHKNLIRVNEPLLKSNYLVWTNASNSFEVKSWKDCIGKKVGIHTSSSYIDNHLPVGIISKTRFAVLDDLSEALKNKEIDVAIINQFEGSNFTVPEGIIEQGSIDSPPTYTYIHKKNIELLPQLEKKLHEMKVDGTIQKILTNDINSSKSAKKAVLSISSFSSDVLWERQLQDGLRAKYEENIPFELYNVSVNALRLRNDKFYRKSIANIIRRDFIDKVPDVVVVSDDEAFEFVKEFYDTLFPGTPVVFCAVNNFSPERIKGYEKKFTGVAETIATKETVDQMLKLFPETKKIFVVTDYTISGRNWRASLEKQLSEYKGTVEFEYNENLPFDELVAKVRSLEEGTLMVCGFYLVDGEGKYQMLGESQKTFFENSKVPIFGLYFPTYGQGQLGGKYSFADVHVKYVREIVKKLLTGMPVSEIPVVTDVYKDYPWYFEYPTMEKFGIKKSQLPKGSIITNEPLSFFDANRSGLIAAAFVLAFVIITLLIVFSRIQRKQYSLLEKTQKSLHTAEEMLQKETEILQVKEQKNMLLEQLQTDLQNVLDSLPVGVLIRNLDDFKPLYVNLSFINMFEFGTVDDAMKYETLNFSPEVQPDNRTSAKAFNDYIKLISTNGETFIFDWRYSLPNGKTLDTKKTSCKIFYNGVPAFVTIIQDVTLEKKQRELLEITAAKEKEANKIKSRFVVNVSHEIRTPMNAIIGLSEIALMKNFDSEVNETFRKVNLSAKNLLSIINDVLDFSKIEAEKLELLENEFVLEDTLYNATMVASKRIANKPIEMLMDLDMNLPTVVWGDKTRLWQIFKNLLDNSAKFTNAGKIQLKASCQEYEDTNENVEFTFVVTDTGLGMTPQQLERLFDSFEQFHQSQSNQSTGTGLGMAITKQLTELMGGSISVASEVNVGTTTTIKIPLKLPKKSISLKQSICKNDFSSQRILIADKTRESIDIMRNLLATANNTPTCVLDKQEVLALVKQAYEAEKPYDLILIDHKLDELEDFEYVTHLKSISPKTSLIMISANPSQFNASDIFNAGFAATIEKPFSPTEFFQKLSSTMGIQQEPVVNYSQTKYVGASVLVVEDNEINQVVAESILEIFGIEPVIADNGKEALDLLETQHFDLIFMDLLMPVMDGHEATLSIRSSDKPYKDIPIIAMTANVVKEEIKACLAEGMNGHIGKPIDLNVLSIQLDKWLAKYATDTEFI